MERRAILAGMGAMMVVGAARAPARFGGDAFSDGVARLEREAGGRIGLAMLDTGSGTRFGHRADERFPMCSTFKWLLVATVLAQVEQGRERLNRTMPVRGADLVDNSPFTTARVGASATVTELCEAAITRSDNAAANLLLPAVGGPAGLTQQLRAWGDPKTRLDRIEPVLNSALPGDPRDTTTPAAMLALLDRLLLGPTLTPRSRARLTGWMLATQTGTKRLRAGLPVGWRVADKTGAGANGSDNEAALLWPPGRSPLIVAAYLTGSGQPLDKTNAVHARLAGLIAAALG